MTMNLWLDLVLAAGVSASVLGVGVACLPSRRFALTGAELLAFGAGAGVLAHGLAGLVVALLPEKRLAAAAALGVLWAGAAWRLTRGPELGRRLGLIEARTRWALGLIALFIAGCVSVTHLGVRFPAELPDGPFIFKEHALPVKIQVMTGNLPVDNYLPFVVTEFLLRDISFAGERPIIPGQEISDRPILLPLVATPFLALLDPPPRQSGPLGKIRYVGRDWPDTGQFMGGAGFRQFLTVGIVLNALLLLGAWMALEAWCPAAGWRLPALGVLATSPFLISQTIFTWPKALAGFFLVLAAHDLARRRPAARVGAWAALAYWAHPYAAVWTVGFGLVYAVGRQWREGLTLAAVVALAVAPWLLWTRLGLRIPDDLLAQNFDRPALPLADHLQCRFDNFWHTLAFPPHVFQEQNGRPALRFATSGGLGTLGLLAPVAYWACWRLRRTHWRLIVGGAVLPLLGLLAVFSHAVPLPLYGLNATAVWLLVLALAALSAAGAREGGVLTLLAGQTALQVALLGMHAHEVGFGWPPAGPTEFYGLLGRPAEIADARLQVNFDVPIAVNGDTRRVIWSEPPTRLTYPHIALLPGAHFQCAVAIHPHVWAEGNADGAEFVLEVACDGQVRRLWSATVDPFSRPADRAWRPVDVDLGEFAGRTVDLILRNGPGPAGNAYADWCLWGEPALTEPGGK